MSFTDNPEWIEYQEYCKERNRKPSLQGFLYWKIYSDTNQKRHQHDNLVVITR